MTEPASAQIAPIPRRAIGYLIDAFIASAIGIVLVGVLVVVATISGGVSAALTVLVVGGPIVLVLLLGWFLVYTAMQAGRGSIGMRAQGLRLVSERDHQPLGFGRVLLRNVIFWLTSSVVVGYFSPLFDGSGRYQGWHDKVAGSLMVGTRGDASPASGPARITPAREPAAATGAGAPPASVLPDLAPATPAAAAPAAPSVPAPVQQAVPATGSAPAPAQPASPGGLIAFVPGITQDQPVRSTPDTANSGSELDATVQAPVAARSAATPASPPTTAFPVPAPPAPVPAEQIEDTRISIPGHRLVFTWDDGTRVAVSRRTIFGRNPAPEDGAVVVSVRDETLSLSKTHFEAAAEPAGGWVVDRHSTNGLILVREGTRIACPPGQRVPVRLGDALEIGDRIVTIGGYA